MANPKPPQPESKTLFVRNISYDTTQEDLNDFMSRFGPVKYAVLCKPKQLEGGEDSAATLQSAHKGTGFVQFKDPLAADKLIELSR